MRKALPSRLFLVPMAALLLFLVACGGQTGVDDSPAVPEGDGQAADDGRKIVRTADIDLAIKDLDVALTDIRSIAGDAGGFVSQSDVVVSDAEDAQVAKPESAVVTIRIPAAQYDAVMDRLRGVAAGVDSEHSNVSEVTGEYTDLQARMNNLQAAETSYLDLLAEAETIDEILRVQEKVNSTRGDIEQAQGRLNVLNNQTDLATITVGLRLVAAAAGDGNWAVHAWNVSLNSSEEMLVVLGTLAIAGSFASLWLIPPLLVAYLVWRRFGSRIAAIAKKLN